MEWSTARVRIASVCGISFGGTGQLIGDTIGENRKEVSRIFTLDKYHTSINILHLWGLGPL